MTTICDNHHRAGRRHRVGPPTTRDRVLDLAVNVSLLGALWLLYAAARGLTAEHMATALGNARSVIAFQDAIGLPSERFLQQDILDKTAIVKGANIYYLAAHFPVTIAFMVGMWWFRREHYTRIRNTLIGVTLVGLALHVVYPLAPPRMTVGFVDTAAIFGPNPYDLGIASAANQIAAMPSLHVGWALLVAIGTIWALDTRWRWLIVLHPLVTTLVVVLTANHYWIDAIMAILLVAVAWIVGGSRMRALERVLVGA